MDNKTSCFHCGDPCPTPPIQSQEKTFCCQGCLTVYEILQANGLENFYKIQEQAGITPKQKGTDFEFLNTPEVQEKLQQFREGDIIHVSFTIPDIHCASCIWLLENLYKLDPGISYSQVRFLEKKLLLKINLSITDLAKVVSLLNKLGYPPHISLENMEEHESKPRDKRFFYRLGVAGFCAGNIMLMSFPEYLGLDSPSFQRFFSYLNLLLALPLLLYSSQEFFKSAMAGLRQRHLNIDVPVSLGILAIFFQSLYDILSHQGPGYLDALAGLVFLLLLGRWFQKISFDYLSFDKDFKSYFPMVAKVLKGGKKSSVLLSELQEGDTIYVRNGQIIPADALLLEKEAWIDYSFVTGESVPVQKEQGEQLFAGGKVIGGEISAKLLKSVSQSYLTQLWQNQGKQTSSNSGLQNITDNLSKHFTLSILLISFLAGMYWLVTADAETALRVAVSVLIVACPCGLALSAPIVLGSTARLLAKNGVFVRDSRLLEKIPQIDTLVFDKTGTLTIPQLDTDADFVQDLSEEEQSLVLSVAEASCHPISQQIQYALQHVPAQKLSYAEEVAGMGIEGRIGTHHAQIGNENFLNYQDMGQLGPGATGIVIDGRLVGSFNRTELPRERLQQILHKLSSNYQLVLLTGDTESRAQDILPFFPKDSEAHWDQLPHQKLSYVKSKQSKGHKVLMVGDGLNDAAAFLEADLGMVVSENLNAFSPASDLILDAQKFSLLPDLMTFVRKSILHLRVALWISLLYNLIGLGIAVLGYLSPWIAAILMPASSLSVILWGMGSTSYLASKNGLRISGENDKSHF